MRQARYFVAGVVALLIPVLVGRASAAEWGRVLEAGKQEGKVVVIGPQGTDVRDGLTKGFQKKYPGIQVDFAGMAGNQVAPKLLNEIAAGRFATDLVVTGTTTALESLIPANAVTPILPFLSGPNTQDPSVWRGKKFNFADSTGRYNLVMTAHVRDPFAYNPQLVSPTEFKSLWHLLDPKWKGQIVLRDPVSAGPGLAVATFWYTHEALGKDFIQKFLTQQDVVIVRDDRQAVDFVAQGKQAIVIGTSHVLTNELIAKGLPLKQLHPDAVKEGTFITAGNGTIVVARNLPHPNAAKVYIDYLLSREGQLEWSKAARSPSLRRDVPTDHVPEILVPKEGVQYQENHSEPYVKLRQEITSFLRPLLAQKAR